MNRLLPWTFALTLLGAALLIAPGALFYYDVTPKAAVILLGCAGALLLAGQWLGGVPALWTSPAGRLLLGSLGLGAGASILATALSDDPALSLTGSEWRRLGLFVELAILLWTLALAGWAAGSGRRVLWALRAFAVAALLGALYGAGQYFGLDPFQPADRYVIGEGEWAIVRTPGALGHAGYFATFLLHGAFAGLALALTETRPGWRRLGAAASALSGAAIVLSGSRSAMLGLAAGGLLVLFWLRPSFSRRTVLAAAVVGLAAVGFYLSPAGEKVRARVRWSAEDASGGGRLLLWRDALGLIGDEWLTGTGPETFSAAFLPYHSVELAQRLPDQYYESPHNIFLDEWTSKGAAGFLSLIGVIVAAWLALLRARSSLAVCLAAGFLAALVSQQFLAFTATTKLYFFAQGALLVAVASPEKTRAVGRFGAMRIAGALAAGGCVWFALGLVRADWLLERVRGAIQAGDMSAAVERYDAFLAAKPGGMYADLWFSREMRHAAASAQGARAGSLWLAGRQAARRAVERSETPQNAWYNMAAVHAEEGDVEAAIRDLQAAADAAPQWYPPFSMLAQVYAVTRREEQAVEPILRAMQLTNGENPEVREVWEALGSPDRP